MCYYLKLLYGHELHWFKRSDTILKFIEYTGKPLQCKHCKKNVKFTFFSGNSVTTMMTDLKNLVEELTYEVLLPRLFISIKPVERLRWFDISS